jgi:hypothetical protein
LAPDIQEELLFLPLVTSGRDPIYAKQLRRICAEVSWRKQRQLWAKLTSRPEVSISAVGESYPPS